MHFSTIFIVFWVVSGYSTNILVVLFSFKRSRLFYFWNKEFKIINHAVYTTKYIYAEVFCVSRVEYT